MRRSLIRSIGIRKVSFLDKDSQATMQKRHRPNRQFRRRDQQPSGPSSHQESSSGLAETTGSHLQRQIKHSPRPIPMHHPVPSYNAISVGTGVSIVLKQDQPTGREVQGIVAELLTRGDHPRGVKVRLRDGRVGRVQNVISEDQGLQGEAAVGGSRAKLGRNGSPIRTAPFISRGGQRERDRFRHTRDARENDEYLYDETGAQTRRTTGYFAALEEADAQYENGRAQNRGTNGEGELGETVTCPVCGHFEGDERAVAHHVDEHFQ